MSSANKQSGGALRGSSPVCDANDLCRESWLSFLSSLLDKHGESCLRLNGQRITKTQRRALQRWKSGASSPSILAADRFLTACSLHLSDYFVYCQINGLHPWTPGVPPAWHDKDWWWQDSE